MIDCFCGWWFWYWESKQMYGSIWPNKYIFDSLLFMISFSILPTDLHNNLTKLQILPTYLLILHPPPQINQIHKFPTLPQTFTPNYKHNLITIPNQIRTLRLYRPIYSLINTLIIHMRSIKNPHIINTISLHT